jgi:glycolate oxidase
MGGLIINNTSGHVVDTCFGKPGDYVLGLEVVLPNGDIMETGSKGLRRPAGTDLTKFFVGSDGILGIVTKIRMRLIPQFKQAYGMAEFKNLSDLAKGVQRLYRERRPAPLFMEMMAHDVAQIGYRIKGLEPPEGSIVMFVETGFSAREAADKLSEILRVFEAERATKTYGISDLDTWHKIWGAREVIGPYLMQQSSDIVNSSEVVSNLKDLVEFMDDSVNFNKGLPLLGKLKNYLYGHIGDLTLHPTFLIPRNWDKETKLKAVKETFQREAEINLKYNTCGGEWGQFSLRTPFFIKKYGEKGYELIKSMKKMMDPNNILNPGILEGYR